MGREKATVLRRTLCPQVLCFLFVYVCLSVCKSVGELICIQPHSKSTRYQAPLLLLEGDGASDKQTTFPVLSHRPLTVLTV